MPMPAIASQIAEKLGLAPAEDVDEAAEAEVFRPVPNRAELRARGLRRRGGARPFRRQRPAPHTLGQASLLRPAEHAKRLATFEELKVAYDCAREAGETWVSPEEEQAWRDRRAGRRRQRAARKASRSS